MSSKKQLHYFALLPQAQAVVPPPDGGYPGNNTAEGDFALFSLTTGFENTALGFAALASNLVGSANTANGFGALVSNTAGSHNTANGDTALFGNTTGNNNTANGDSALFSNTTGNNNTANGDTALFENPTGSNNTANGFGALASNNIGNNNTAVGVNALLQNTTGAANIALGVNAGSNLTTGNGNIDIGNVGNGAEANTIRIGEQGLQTATFIAGISGATVTGTAVVVDGSGQLGVAPSSARFKEAIKSMDNASEALFSLKPITFRYKKGIDPQGIPQFGLVAEEVEKVNPDLVVRDANGAVYTVRYDAVNAMLLNEFLKEHRTVQDLKSTVAKQEATIAQQQTSFQSKLAEQERQIAALTAGLQKVSAQLEASKPAPQVVNNP